MQICQPMSLIASLAWSNAVSLRYPRHSPDSIDNTLLWHRVLVASQELQRAWKAFAIPAIPLAGSYTDALRQVCEKISCTQFPAPMQAWPGSIPLARQGGLTLPGQVAASAIPAGSAPTGQPFAISNASAKAPQLDSSNGSISQMDAAPSCSSKMQLAVQGELPHHMASEQHACRFIHAGHILSNLE